MLPKNMSKFASALVDYLKDQTQSWSFQEFEKPNSAGYKFRLQVNTGPQRLNDEQREHIRSLVENRVPARYSVELEFIPK